MSQIKQVFISHDSADSILAHRLAEDIKRCGVKVWIAPESIKPGEGWVKAINRGLSESSHMVTVLTPSALKSKWVNMETEVAIDKERKGQLTVIMLDVKPCKPPDLWNYYQRIPFRDQYEKDLKKLATTLGLVMEPEKPLTSSKPHPEPLPKPRTEPTPQPEPKQKQLKMSQILKRVRKIVAEQFGVPISSVQPETNLIYDLNADDMDLTEIPMELEDEFNMCIPEDEADKLHTVRDWAAYIYQCMQG
jgi:acyl carrier protein